MDIKSGIFLTLPVTSLSFTVKKYRYYQDVTAAILTVNLLVMDLIRQLMERNMVNN